MKNIKLFDFNSKALEEVLGDIDYVEKDIQNNIEGSLYDIFKVTFLATEYVTRKSAFSDENGRIDTLGIDEDDNPTIIEYKKKKDQCIVNQALFYLDWLVDHKDAFKVLVQEKINYERAKKIKWTNPRVLCVAPEFTKFDEYAIRQIDRNIQLVFYKKFTNNQMAFGIVNPIKEVIHKKISSPCEPELPIKSSVKYNISVSRFDDMTWKLYPLFIQLKEYILQLGDDIQIKKNSDHLAISKFYNFLALEATAERIKLGFEFLDSEIKEIEPLLDNAKKDGIEFRSTKDLYKKNSAAIRLWFDKEEHFKSVFSIIDYLYNR